MLIPVEDAPTVDPVKTPADLRFDNTYARLPPEFHRPVRPTPLRQAYLAHFNQRAAGLLDLAPEFAEHPDLVDLLTGRQSREGSEPLAMLYAGHQFGHWVPQLGDGRAILLGEVRNTRGETWDLHLKGAGETPFSRDGDGRAALRSSIREYLCSEAMHGLGIPTTRALCLIGSREEVYRERIESGAMLLRLAPSHVRFGSFDRQPDIGLWNLSCFAQALLPLLDPDNGEAAADKVRSALGGYRAELGRAYAEGMRAKLGLRKVVEHDGALVTRLLDLLAEHQVDYSRFFRALGRLERDAPVADAPIRDQFLDREAFDAWARDYRARLAAEGGEDDQRRARMDRVNPQYILRNYLAQEATIAAEQDDFSELERLLGILVDPFAEQPEHQAYAAPPPDWGRRIVVSCSS